jgi:precorrin-2/cobalt-factor-2 C20-methyltransferase
MPEGAGRLHGVGVGPGDPELLTLKALRLLQSAPVIAYPAPENGDSFARSIVAPWIGAHQREIAIRLPMRPGPLPAWIYDEGAAVVASELDRGNDVALLCQGDPLFYGSFINLFVRLAGRYRIEIVPGVSSLSGCAAAAGFPLVWREHALTVVPATLEADQIMARLAHVDTAAIIKIGRHLTKVRRILERLGLLDEAVFVEHASLPTQRVAPLAGIEQAAYFSMVLVHMCLRDRHAAGMADLARRCNGRG